MVRTVRSPCCSGVSPQAVRLSRRSVSFRAGSASSSARTARAASSVEAAGDGCRRRSRPSSGGSWTKPIGRRAARRPPLVEQQAVHRAEVLRGDQRHEEPSSEPDAQQQAGEAAEVHCPKEILAHAGGGGGPIRIVPMAPLCPGVPTMVVTSRREGAALLRVQGPMCEVLFSPARLPV